MKTFKKKYYIIPIMVCMLGVMGIIIYYMSGSFSHSESCEYVYIDEQDNLNTLSDKLAPIASEHGLFVFRLLARHTDYAKHIRSGKYAICPDESPLSVFRKLKNGQQEPVRLTIPESRTTNKLAAALSQKLMMDSTALSILLHDSVFCTRLGFDTATIVCMFVPNTYEVYWNVSIDRLMNRMKKEHDIFWNGKRNEKADSIGLSPDEVCTLASIIDEETANNVEKPIIAGMYMNRLQKGMPLQADPTIKFALNNFALRRIYHDMLTYDSPYNTYKNAGLPPGPIKIASVSGIDAVLNYEKHTYLYMCAKEDFSGTHNFATTYQEHLKNAAKYSKALNERGIK